MTYLIDPETPNILLFFFFRTYASQIRINIYISGGAPRLYVYRAREKYRGVKYNRIWTLRFQFDKSRDNCKTVSHVPKKKWKNTAPNHLIVSHCSGRHVINNCDTGAIFAAATLPHFGESVALFPFRRNALVFRAGYFRIRKLRPVQRVKLFRNLCRTRRAYNPRFYIQHPCAHLYRIAAPARAYLIIGRYRNI